MSADFENAVKDSRKLKAKPTDDELLQLYGLFKQGSKESIENSPKPGNFDFKGKYKRKAWQKVIDDGTTPEEAQKKYVELVEQLKAKHGYEG